MRGIVLVTMVIGVLCLAMETTRGAEVVVKRVFRAEEVLTKNLLMPDRWEPFGKGFRREGRMFVCDNGADTSVVRGVHQVVELNQKVVTPIVATAWSKAEKVGGNSDSGYSLYLDLTYADGTPLWGQIATFAVGTHDWQKAQVVVFPEKPVRSVNLHLLFRYHSGKVWFRDAFLAQREFKQGMAPFHGVVVSTVKPGYEGFMVRDVAADTDFVAPEKGMALGVRCQVVAKRELSFPGGQTANVFRAVFEDTTGKDRALSIVYALPLGRGPLQWLASPRKSVIAKPPTDYERLVRVAAGSGAMSRYPFAAVCSKDKGYALGLDMHYPAVFRVGFAAASNELHIGFDIALTPEKPKATVGFCVFTFDPKWKFRAALQRYYEIFPDFFKCRVKKQGTWMPFYRISKVKGWKDFGFQFKEGTNETAWDDAHGITTFRYTEPMTWWMHMPVAKGERTLAAALAYAKKLAAKGKPQAKALFTSGFYDEKGQYVARLLDRPWCNGAVWSMNSAPGIRGDVTDFKLKWSEKIKEKLYGPGRKADQDGEYVDSSEGYVTAQLDFRRDHFAAMDTPLTFAANSKRPGIFRGLIAYEYVRALARDVHAMGKFMMANSTPSRLCWLAPWLDVMGTETNWNSSGWSPMTDEELLFRRAMCGPKPYCFLMNTDFDKFSHELVDKYMQRALAYGMFPGFFSPNASTGHYFSRPELYNRDRPLFRKYVPLCKRVAEAGWKPITKAHSSVDCVYVERFGDRYLTVFNDSNGPRTAVITLELPKPRRCVDLVSGSDIRWAGDPPKTSITLAPESVAVLDLKP